MNASQNKQKVEQVFNEVMNKRNFSLLNDIIAPAYTNHSMPTDTPGPEGLKGALQMFLDGFPDIQITIEKIVAEGDLVATKGHWTGTHKGSFMGIPATGIQVNINYMDFWRFENGKAVENWVQMDNAAIMQQLGVVPQPA